MASREPKNSFKFFKLNIGNQRYNQSFALVSFATGILPFCFFELRGRFESVADPA